MAVTRTFKSLGVVASDADIVIPPTPISGTAYRNTAFTEGENKLGEQFDTVPDSADFNQKQFIISSFTNMIDTNGVPGWTNVVDYDRPALVWGSDNLFYFALAASGPSTTPQDPVTTTGFWEFLDTTNDQEIANISSAVTTYADTGAVNAYVVTGVGPASPNAYIEGTKINFYANFSNTGASTINVNGLGVRPLINEDTSALSANQIRDNTWTQAIIEGTNATLVNSSERLSFDLSAQSAPTGASLIGTTVQGGTTVEAALIQIGPLPKMHAWVKASGLDPSPNGNQTINASENVTTFVKDSEGFFTINFTVAAASANLGVFMQPYNLGIGGRVQLTSVFGIAAGSASIEFTNRMGGAENPLEAFVQIFDLT